MGVSQMAQKWNELTAAILSIKFFDQLWIMLKRNYLFQKRYWVATLSQTILAPFLFQLLLFTLQLAYVQKQSESNYHPSSSSLGGFVPCQGVTYGAPCITLMFTPQIEPYTSFINQFQKMNAIRIGKTLTVATTLMTSLNPPTSIIDIVPVANADFIYNYTLQNPNTTAWGVVFNTAGSGTTVNYQYQVWFNSSQTAVQADIFGQQVLNFVRGMDEAIITILNDPNASIQATIDTQVKDWPLIPPSYIGDTIIQNLGPVFFFCTQMVIFISVLSQIVTEKELRLRKFMETMGLYPSVYWLSQFLSVTSLVFTSALFTSIFGCMFQFKTFLKTNFGVLLITFFLFGESMLALAFFLTAFVRTSRVAIFIGIFIFIIGLVFEAAVFSSSFVGYIWWSEATITPAAWKVLILIPFFNFGRMFLDLGAFTNGLYDSLSDTYTPGPGFSWATLYSNLPSSVLPSYGSTSVYPNVPPPINSWYYMIMNVFLYMALLWYFDNVIPDEFDYSRPWYFFLQPSYWGLGRSKSSSSQLEWLLKIKKQDNKRPFYYYLLPSYWGLAKKSSIEQKIVLETDDDVSNERDRALSEGYEPALKIVNLRKVYNNSFFDFAPKKVAVNDLCLTLEQGKLLALLGQNGAGKTTIMSMLSGLTPSTSGDALLCNFSMKDQMTDIRSIMSICPQYDVLFNDLTAKEHIELYAGLKGVHKDEYETELEERLKAVKLWTVRDVRAGTYSGGMKRRLSLIISTIGNPKIIYMDEPTTGMDPVNRRHVWAFIEKFKKGRVVILTSHSMEEADVLGDRIAIMAKGNLLAIGNSIHLKSKFGAGYRISLITNESDSVDVKKDFDSIIPGCILEDDSAGALIYQCPPSSIPNIPAFAAWVEKNEENRIKNWGISQSTLEEVFLKLIRSVNPTSLKKRN